MKRLILPLVLITALLSFNTQAFKVYGGYGGESCGTWIEERKNNNFSIQEVAMEQWAFGFIEGADWASVELKETDINAIPAWFDNYCQANPLDAIADATIALIHKLEAMK